MTASPDPGGVERFWLAETYLSGTAGLPARLATLAGAAAGRGVRCIRAIAVPEDEVCFIVLAAAGDDDVREAARIAELPLARVSPAEEIVPAG